MRSRLIVALTIAALLVVGLGGWVIVGDLGRVRAAPPPVVPTQEQLVSASSGRVFFAHQSVGRNILDSLPNVYTARGLAPPDVVESLNPQNQGSGYIQHTYIGENGAPLGKLEEFDAALRGGLAARVDVAILKFCYLDVREGDDAAAIFRAYEATMAALERDHPDVTLLYATVPLTTQRGPLGKVRAFVGLGDSLGPEHNVVREQFNALIRKRYQGTARLFDIAAMQSTSADGQQVVRTRDGLEYVEMEESYASDPGHLNPEGASVAAGVLLALVAEALDEA